jgi:hypothetical protein
MSTTIIGRHGGAKLRFATFKTAIEQFVLKGLTTDETPRWHNRVIVKFEEGRDNRHPPGDMDGMTEFCRQGRRKQFAASAAGSFLHRRFQ